VDETSISFLKEFDNIKTFSCKNLLTETGKTKVLPPNPPQADKLPQKIKHILRCNFTSMVKTLRAI